MEAMLANSCRRIRVFFDPIVICRPLVLLSLLAIGGGLSCDEAGGAQGHPEDTEPGISQTTGLHHSETHESSEIGGSATGFLQPDMPQGIAGSSSPGLSSIQGESELYFKALSPIEQNTAEQIALYYTRTIEEQARVVFTDVVYWEGSTLPWQYIVVLAVDERYFGSSRESLLQLLDGNRSDAAVRAALSEGIRSVYVSVTADRHPIPLVGTGLPIHILRLDEMVEEAGKRFPEPEVELSPIGLSYVLDRGIYLKLMVNDHPAEKVSISPFTLKIIDQDVLEALALSPRVLEVYAAERVDFVEDVRHSWNHYFGNMDARSPQKRSVQYISSYSHSSLKWSQNQITSGLPCSSSGGCCFVAATAAVLAFWDDHTYYGNGPYENLVQNGSGTSQGAVSNLASDLYDEIAIGGKCFGSLFSMDLCAYQISDGADDLATARGYSFDTDGDSWPSESDVASEVAADRPFVWVLDGYDMNGFNGFQEINHAVTGIGYYYDAEDVMRIRAYTNWYNGEMYDFLWDIPWDFDGHALVSFVPDLASVDLMFLDARGNQDSVSVLWETSTETGNAGWHIYRSEEEGVLGVRLNETLMVANQYWYDYQDTEVDHFRRYYYTVEDVDVDGTSTTHGPVWASANPYDFNNDQRVDGLDLGLLSAGLPEAVGETHGGLIDATSSVSDCDFCRFFGLGVSGR